MIARLVDRMAKANEKYHRFVSGEEAHAFGMRHATPWVARLQTPDTSELNRNRAGERYAMNAALRGVERPGRPSMPLHEAIAHRDLISEAIKKAPPLEHNIVVHRAVTNQHWNPHESLKVGSTWHDPGIPSTALHRDQMEDFDAQRYGDQKGTHFEIHVPKGTPGAYVDHPSFTPPGTSVPWFTEMLLNHHTHFKILHNDPVKRHIVMQVVPKS